MNIDWELLREQKHQLIALAFSDTATIKETEALEGVINLLDTIQDEAVSSGLADEETVFGKKTDE
jgi:hypothetical protein